MSSTARLHNKLGDAIIRHESHQYLSLRLVSYVYTTILFTTLTNDLTTTHDTTEISIAPRGGKTWSGDLNFICF